MPITAAPSTFYNLQIKPDFVADTLAELDAALGTYAGKYVLVNEDSRIYYVAVNRNVPSRVEAYNFSNYRSDPGLPGLDVYFNTTTPPPNGIGSDNDVLLNPLENRWYKKAGGVWVDQGSTLLYIGDTLPGLVTNQKGFGIVTGEFSDPEIVQPYISLGT